MPEVIDMTEDPDTQLFALFQQGGGYLTARELQDSGIYFNLLRRWEHQGKVHKLQRGVYRLADASMLSHEELLELQLRFPKARYCLITALFLHGLTTTQPLKIQLAFPHNHLFPGVDHPPVEVYYFRPGRYLPHMQDLPIAGTTRTLQVYSPEKTLCDLLRYHKKLGRELYIEGLKKYLRQHPHPHVLLSVAREQNVTHTLMPDLEVLLHDIDT